jgi:hypothetical protein
MSPVIFGVAGGGCIVALFDNGRWTAYYLGPKHGVAFDTLGYGADPESAARNLWSELHGG